MAKKWWCAAQERRKGELCLFSWQGYPRWPGVVVPPQAKCELLAGNGHFYPPDKKVLFSTELGAALSSTSRREHARWCR